jgi:hypothetical protein
MPVLEAAEARGWLSVIVVVVSPIDPFDLADHGPQRAGPPRELGLVAAQLQLALTGAERESVDLVLPFDLLEKGGGAVALQRAEGRLLLSVGLCGARGGRGEGRGAECGWAPRTACTCMGREGVSRSGAERG